MALINTTSGYSNVIAATVQTAQVVSPPVIEIPVRTIYEGEKLKVCWNDLARAIVLEISDDPNFSRLVNTVAGVGANGGFYVPLNPGTYWIRGKWQDGMISPPPPPPGGGYDSLRGPSNARGY